MHLAAAVVAIGLVAGLYVRGTVLRYEAGWESTFLDASQVHALLYLSQEPVNAEEIAKTLAVARSNVSTSLRELQGWGIIKPVHLLGDRREHYEAMKDVWEMARVILDERKRREIDPTVALLAECRAELGMAEARQRHRHDAKSVFLHSEVARTVEGARGPFAARGRGGRDELDVPGERRQPRQLEPDAAVALASQHAAAGGDDAFMRPARGSLGSAPRTLDWARGPMQRYFEANPDPLNLFPQPVPAAQPNTFAASVVVKSSISTLHD